MPLYILDYYKVNNIQNLYSWYNYLLYSEIILKMYIRIFVDFSHGRCRIMKLFEVLKRKFRSISIKTIVIIAFSSFMLITISLAAFITYKNWIHSENENINIIIKRINEEMIRGINTLTDLPSNINKSNYNLLEKDVIDIEDEKQRDRFFVGVLSGNKDEPIYSFSYGTETGEYYGARKNEKNEIEIMKNNATTGGHSWYYSVTKEMNVGILAVKAGEFDPRTRDWYRVAKEKGKPSFSSVYKHFIMEDLTISASYPIYDTTGNLKGVLGSHIILAGLNDYLKNIAKDKNVVALIVEKETGELIANTLDKDNFRTIDGGVFKRVTVDELDDEIMSKALTRYLTEEDSVFTVKFKDGKYRIHVEEYNKEGLNWLIVTSISENLLKAEIMWNMKLTVLLIVLALIFFVSIYMKLVNKLFEPIDNLIETTEKFAKGDLDKRGHVKRTDEIGRIVGAFNNMADTISHFINDLEQMVKDRTSELETMSYQDSLTGLYNRAFFEIELRRLDRPRNLPFSIVSADLNGLKLINDTFGHESGDMLLKKAASTFKKVCRGDDIIARIGGDEFAILLPNTKEEEAEKIVGRIVKECTKEHVASVKCSIALGSATKKRVEEDIIDTLKESEDKMYTDKTLNRKNNALNQIQAIIGTLHSKGYNEKEHSERVSELSGKIGIAMGLDDEEIKTLKDAGYLHDIGKVVLDSKIINNKNDLNKSEQSAMMQHPIIGYRILNTFDETLDLAQYVLTHHERWDGSGYPKGLKGEEIPRLSRILAVAEDYEGLVATMEPEEAAKEIIKKSGERYDPETIEAFKLVDHVGRK